MKNKLKELLELRDYYFDDPERIDEEWLKNAVEDLNMVVPDFTKEESVGETRLFICPDLEYEFPFVIEFSKENFKEGIEITYEAIKEYYAYSDFYDCYTPFLVEELLKIFFAAYDISIVRFFETREVATLNVGKLNSEI